MRKGQEELVREFLPKVRVEATEFAQFQARFPEIWLEIGFGGGEYLAARARENPTIGFIGCEPFLNGMAKLLAVVAQEKRNNVSVWDEDVSDLLPTLPDRSFNLVHILYPDPWPKRRQRKRRLVSDAMLIELARVMKPKAELRFASDIDDYAGWVLARILRSPHFRWKAECAEDWRRPWPNWPGTRYEAKAIREGRVPSYLTFERV